jgi:LPXTG-site transpeptidase (sortase) family protein
MGGRVGQIARSLVGAGLPRRKRWLRLGSTACLLGAVALLVLAGTLAFTSGPARKPLPRGTLFSVPLAALASPGAAVATPSPVSSAPTSATAASAEPATASPTPKPATSPTPEPTPPPDDSPVVRLIVPAIGVDAPISVKGVDANGVMEDPNSWYDVAYYNFSGKPGYGPGNNAVFGGHVDYYPHRTAVFWNLRNLKPGDAVQVVLQDGKTYTYLVTQMNVYGANDAPIDQILGDTPEESVTLITCDGTFANGEYNNRLVVRAQRQPDSASNQQ